MGTDFNSFFNHKDLKPLLNSLTGGEEIQIKAWQGLLSIVYQEAKGSHKEKSHACLLKINEMLEK